MLEHLQSFSTTRKIAVINNDPLRFQVDFAALQEIMLSDSGTLPERKYTIF